jgi:hypothetical protein
MDQLTQQKQLAALGQWRAEIETCLARLGHAAGNAARAVDHWREFVAMADAETIAATGQSIAAELLAVEANSLGHLAALCQAFAGATGQSTAEVVAKISAALE